MLRVPREAPAFDCGERMRPKRPAAECVGLIGGQVETRPPASHAKSSAPEEARVVAASAAPVIARFDESNLSPPRAVQGRARRYRPRHDDDVYASVIRALSASNQQ